MGAHPAQGTTRKYFQFIVIDNAPEVPFQIRQENRRKTQTRATVKSYYRLKAEKRKWYLCKF
jgi:hypothetical protein